MAKKIKKTPITTQTHKERLRKQSEEARAKAARIRRIVVGTAILLGVVLVVVFIFVVIGQMQKNELMNSVTPADANEERTAMQIAPGMAKAAAPNVGLYFDYQCSGCADLEKAIGTELFRLANSGDINLQLHTVTGLDYYYGSGSDSTKAAIGATCAAHVGGNEVYQKYHQAIFTYYAGAEGYTDATLLTLPQVAGLPEDKQDAFDQCYNDKLTKGFVDGMSAASFKDGITGTPTISINGTMFTDYTGIDTDVLAWITERAK
ncbi:MAG: DsbA family protein [Propionibacteriaceae bacterium]|nr:DsbA family protein [Propionibacteriaceae bacterium]